MASERFKFSDEHIDFIRLHWDKKPSVLVKLFHQKFGLLKQRQVLSKLKEQLETLLYKHYLIYQPECYFFIAERPSLSRMYQKMCDNRHPLMIDFQPIGQLGENSDCFIIKTPNYKE